MRVASSLVIRAALSGVLLGTLVLMNLEVVPLDRVLQLDAAALVELKRRNLTLSRLPEALMSGEYARPCHAAAQAWVGPLRTSRRALRTLGHVPARFRRLHSRSPLASHFQKMASLRGRCHRVELSRSLVALGQSSAGRHGVVLAVRPRLSYCIRPRFRLRCRPLSSSLSLETVVFRKC